MAPYIAVVGTGEPDPSLEEVAEEVGAGIARAGAVLVSGGLGGVMEAASRGAKEAGGLVVGLLPGSGRAAANAYLDVALPTGMGEMRNVLVVRAADAVIAVGGEFGTLSEIAFALKAGTPVVGIDTWEPAKGGRATDAIARATSAPDAVSQALTLARAAQ